MKFPARWCATLTRLVAAVLLSSSFFDTTSAHSSSLHLAQHQATTPSQKAAPPNQTTETTSQPSIVKIAEMGGGLRVSDVQLSSDKKKVFVLVLGSPFIWEPEKDAGIRVVNCGMIIGKGDLCVSPKFGLDGMMVLQTATAKELYRLPKDKPNVVVSPLGSYLAAKSVTAGIDLLDSKDGSRIAHLAGTWGYEEVVFSRDESLVAANDTEQFVVYDFKGKKIRKVDVTSVKSFAVSSKGVYLWVSSNYAEPQVLTAGGKRVSRQFPEEYSSRYEHSVFGHFFDSDSKVVMRTSSEEVAVWDLKSNTISELATKTEHLSVAENGILIVTKEGAAELWDRSLKKVHTFEGRMGRAIIASDGSCVVTATRDGTLAFWNVRM